MKQAVGIDLGGTKIEAALVYENGEILKSARYPTSEDWEETLSNILKAVSEVRKDGCPVGLGTPGNYVNGKIHSSNIPDIQKVIDGFLQRYPEAEIENDANCFALAEHRWGLGKDNMIGLIWGTGIGAGIVINGRLYRGSGEAGEPGHTIIDKNIVNYENGGKGTWEYYCAGPGIVRRYKEAGGDESVGTPAEVWSKPDGKDVIEETIRIMAIGISNLIKFLDPEIVVLGGGVSNLEILEELNEKVKEYSGNECKVVKTSLNKAGSLGAAALVL